MNFSYSKNFFNSFYKNIANNKNSMKYFNTKINSMKSLNFFSNKMHFSSMIILANIILGKRLASIVNANSLSTEIKSSDSTLANNPSSEMLSELNSKILNDIFQVNNSKI